jgi:hypothetical protein
MEIREQVDKCDISAKKSTTGKESIYSKLKNIIFAWYQQAQASGIPVDGTILREKSLKIPATMVIENFSASNGWISCFKQCHGLVFKKFGGEGSAVDINTRDLWLKDFQSCWRATKLRTSIMQMNQASFSTACRTKCWH